MASEFMRAVSPTGFLFRIELHVSLWMASNVLAEAKDCIALMCLRYLFLVKTIQERSRNLPIFSCAEQRRFEKEAVFHSLWPDMDCPSSLLGAQETVTSDVEQMRFEPLACGRDCSALAR